MAVAAHFSWPEATGPAPRGDGPAPGCEGAREDDVERRCAALARSAGPLRRALAALADRFVVGPGRGKAKATGWQRLGFTRAGDYARERLGISGRELHDLARVDTALATLPRLEAALVSGALPWTRVRLLARAARPEDEARWIAYARRVPADALETEVRAVDAGLLAEVLSALPMDAVARARVEAEKRAEAGARAQAPRGRPARERFAARWWQRSEVANAFRREAANGFRREAANAFRREIANGFRREAANAFRREIAPGEARGELPAFVKALVEGLEKAHPSELDRRLRRAVALEQRFEAALGPWLERVAADRLYRARGYASLDDYARERLGMSPRKARALLRIERAGRACPALRSAYRRGRLSWVQTQALVPVLLMHPTRAPAWIAFAAHVPVRRLRDHVDRAVRLAERDAEAFAETAGVPGLDDGNRLQIRAKPTDLERTHTPPESGAPASLRDGRIFFTAPADVAREVMRFEPGVRPEAPPLVVYASSSPTARQASSMAASV